MLKFSVQMSHGELTGLTTLERNGDSSIHYNRNIHMASIHAALAVHHINIIYQMSFLGGPFRYTDELYDNCMTTLKL